MEYELYTNEELFVFYNQTHDMECKKVLALRYLPVIRAIAYQMKNVYVGFEELEGIINEGILVLLKSIDRYELDKEVKFETYISKRIRGMIIDLARKQDFVSRDLRKGYNDIVAEQTKFYQEYGREATQQEIMELLEMDQKKYQSIMEKSNLLQVCSLDMLVEEVILKKSVSQPEELFVKKELGEALQQAIKSLKDKEQQVISLYYIEEVNMKEIGSILELSEARVSQIHRQAIQKLKVALSEMV